jgi:ribosomal protein S27AE
VVRRSRHPDDRPALRLLPAAGAPEPDATIAPSVPGHGPGRSPRYACGSCDALVLSGAPLQSFAARSGGHSPAVRCPNCGALSFLQVTSRRLPRTLSTGRSPVHGRWELVLLPDS